MNLCDLIFLQYPKSNKKVKFIKDKMNRVFIYRDGNFISTQFPFNIEFFDELDIKIYTYSGNTIDNKSISAVKSLLNQFNSHTFVDLKHLEWDEEDDYLNEIGKEIIYELLLIEPSYIRYDHDPKNERGRIHPLHHFDINYSSNGVFKLGLSYQINEQYFEDTMDTCTDSKFIEKE